MLSSKNNRLVRFKKSVWVPKRGFRNHAIMEFVARYGDGPFQVVLEQDNSITILTAVGNKLFPESYFEDVVSVATSAN